MDNKRKVTDRNYQPEEGSIWGALFLIVIVVVALVNAIYSVVVELMK